MSKRVSSLILGIAAMAVKPGFAATYEDFSQSTGSIEVISTQPVATTVLRTVAVVCPANGWLVATADAEFQVDGSAFSSVIIDFAFGITRNSGAPFPEDPNHVRRVAPGFTANPYISPGAMQRIDQCVASQSVTYRFIAYENTGMGSLTARQPRLTVRYFDSRL